MIGLGSDKKDFRTVKCPLTILTNQTLFVSLNPLVYERHKDKGGLFRKRLNGGAKSTLLQPVIIVFPPMKAGRQRNVISLKSIRPSEEKAAWLYFFFKLLDAHSWASKQIKEDKKKELKSERYKPFAWVMLGHEFFSRLPGVHFQHHHPLIQSFFFLQGLNYILSLQNILFHISKFVNLIWLIKFSK